MVVAVVQFELIMPSPQSLKDKRHRLQKLKDKCLAQFKIVLAEVAYQDLWQRAGLAFTLVGQDEKTLDSLIARAMNLIVSSNLGEVCAEERDILHYDLKDRNYAERYHEKWT